ncbi:septum site-determining protein Ssd [Rhodococcoides yunnanense]|uniref:septum site-determining protein Ssd n=1 Tax=Rhodococcoides yunnanense TaxID=278209 RepID=UPI0009348F81|nr:septum site-determining protein Ssd [Rhodococcus yunnanensis]
MKLDTTPTDGVRTVLLLTADQALAADATRVVAATDCVLLERNSESAGAPTRIEWDEAHAVLLDHPHVSDVLARRLPRRDGVVVLARGTPGLEHWRAATTVGAAHVIGLPENEHELVRVLAANTRSPGGDGGVIAVIGGRGGAGASTFATAVASVSAADGRRTLLVDGDGFGAGLDLMLGWEDRPGLRWSGLVVEAGRVSADALHAALPSDGALSVLSTARGSTHVDRTACEAVVDAGRTAGDLVVCDVPRHPGVESGVLVDGADLVLLLVPAEVGAVASADAVARYVVSRNSNVGVVVRGPSPGGIRAVDVARSLELPLLASMRPEPRLASRSERGGLTLRRRSPLHTAASEILETFGRRPRHRQWAA